ncbi:MAG: Hpt domain-containing protein [Xanthomonadales bacterium]|nr:Hpt domain-containing protein [Xanthomonadales bacterium]
MTTVQIDQSMLEQFRMLERAGKPGVLKQMVGMFLKGSAEQIAAIAAASAAADGEKLRVASHTLKSNAASFGATALAESCREIEYAAKAGTCTLAADALERLRALHQASCTALQRAID